MLVGTSASYCRLVWHELDWGGENEKEKGKRRKEEEKR